MNTETLNLSSNISNHPIFVSSYPSHFSDNSDTPLSPNIIKSKFQQFSSSLKTLSSEQKEINDRIKQYTFSPESFEKMKQYFIQNEEVKSDLYEGIDSLGQQLSNMEGVVLQLSKDMNEKFSEIDKKFSEIDKKFSEIDKKFSEIDRKISAIDRKIDAKFSILFVVQMISILFSIIAISHH